jgi:uncharacterized protein YndB with AHSA1/START domain
MKPLTVQVELSIRKPVKHVFKAALTPVPFFLKRASGPMKAGQKITWEFQEFPGGFPVFVRQVVRNKRIRFEWPRDNGQNLNTVEFHFKRFGPKITTMVISESGWPDTKKWRVTSYRNVQGWMHMACSLKAYLEYGVNLRQGSFVHMTFR